MRSIKISWIIHIFALLHAIVTFSCRYAGFEDEMLLTILTMTMILLLCLKRGMNIELTAASIIVANILGYLLGNASASLLSLALASPYIVHSLATILTTEILGWSVIVFSKIFRKGDKDPVSSSYITWLILAMVVIFILRLAFIFILSGTSVE